MPTELKDHFLDANILIGCSASFDHFNDLLGGYFRKNLDFFTSPLALDEAKAVLETHEKIATNQASKVYHLLNGENPSISKLTEKYKEMSYGSYGQGLSDSYLEVKKKEILKHIENSDEKSLLLMIQENFSSARERLRNNVNREKFELKENCSGKEHKSHSKNLYDNLLDVISHENDTLIVMDGNEIGEQLGKEILFATTDKNHIWSEKEKIMEETDFLEVRHPESHLED